MSFEKTDVDLGTMLKTLLKERSLSMRKLSALTGIDTATISRIANGKQQAKPDHLQQFARHLGVPTQRLFQAAGFDVGRQNSGKPSDIHESVDTIQEVLVSSNLLDQQFTTERVRQELIKYEKYALTEEGQRIILEDFRPKVEQVSGAGPFIDQLKHMFELFCSKSVTPTERALIGSALLYFILSTDIIPDYVFPIGYLDDAIAVQLVLDRLAQLDESAGRSQKDGES
ncbi:DUF1232 domain-containing protein [Brevibacillus sp. B_LB10_24]|uniref:DUF1232 domain-containing protein n=1 Tax=Brevibacillus sp. B_LB10_24 TaxID=3380645 RepID=UPI0038B7B5D2